MFSGKKKNLFILVLLLATFFTFAPDISFAQATLDPTATDTGAAYVTQPFDPLGSVVYRALTAIGGLVAWLGGTLLNISLSMFVFNLPETVRVFALMDIIDYVWSFVRDIFNLLFIFGLTWIGFRFILGINVSDAKRNLGTILIAALLINFSLYATQLIIDVGNVAAAEIGDLFTPAEGSPTQNVLGIEIIDVASSFIASTDIANIGSHTLALSSYSSTGEEIDVGSGRALGLADALGMGLTIAVLLILIGFVFAAGAFLMFARFFYLLFLMMFSPIMFLGFVLPQMQNVTKDWWTKLINQTIVGPAYLFMLLIALRALDTLMQSRGDDLMNTWGFIISSLLVAAFVWASLIVAKKFGGAGAATAMNMGQGMGRSIRGYAGRSAIGRVADNWSRGMEARGVNDRSIRRRIASSLAGNKFGGSTSATDARASDKKASQQKARWEQVHGKTGISASIKSGLNPAADDTTRVAMERKVAGASNEQVMELLDEYKVGSPEYSALVATMTDSQFESAMKSKAEELDDKAKADLGKKRNEVVVTSLTAAERKKDADEIAAGTRATERTSQELMSSSIKNAKEAQLRVLGAEEIVKHAADLKQSQFDDIMKSKDYTPTEQNRIKEAREGELWKRFDTGTNIFAGLQDKDIASLPKKILLDDQGRQLPYLTGGALRKIAEDDKLNQADRTELIQIMTKPGTPGKHSTADKYLNSPQGQEKYG